MSDSDSRTGNTRPQGFEDGSHRAAAQCLLRLSGIIGIIVFCGTLALLVLGIIHGRISDTGSLVVAAGLVAAMAAICWRMYLQLDAGRNVRRFRLLFATVANLILLGPFILFLLPRTLYHAVAGLFAPAELRNMPIWGSSLIVVVAGVLFFVVQILNYRAYWRLGQARRETTDPTNVA